MEPKEVRLLNQAADAKLLHANANLLFPLLLRKEEEAIAILCEKFKSDGAISTAKVAYIAACRDLRAELDAIARKGEHASKVLNMHPDIT